MFKKLFFIAAMLTVSSVQMLAWKPLFVGHRGCNKGVENTAEAFRNGVDAYGYDGLECDVRVTSDGHYVISHDETTNRLGGNLTVASATLADLQAETYTQTRSGVTYTGTICTVAEYLDICLEKNVFPIIELKWTTGINTNDMSNFPGLAQLVIDKGLADKAIFLTSMKGSLEYVRNHYPQFKCQWLGNANWTNNIEWCDQWDIDASLQAGTFDIYTVKKFRDRGLNVAVWTVDTKANYELYGNMGVNVITTNSLDLEQTTELDDIDWDNIHEAEAPVELLVDTLFKYSQVNGNLPANFPSGIADNSTLNSAQQATVIDGVFYANNYTTSQLVMLDAEGNLDVTTGTSSHGICRDDAGNLIQRNDGLSKTPNKLVVKPYGQDQQVEIDFELNDNGQTNFISATGDIMSAEGGWVYFFPNSQTVVNAVHIVNGEFDDVVASTALSLTASTAGVVYPLGNGIDKFVYQVRNKGFYLYDDGDKGAYLTGSSTTTAPGRNSSVGGAIFNIAGHEILVHPSGTNYNGGFSVKDMTAAGENVLTFAPMGSVGYGGNPSTGAFFTVDVINDQAVTLYEYCMGNGYAAYLIHTPDYDPTVTGVTTVAGDKTVRSVSYYDLSGRLLANPTSGICIKVEQLSDGSRRSTKVAL